MRQISAFKSKALSSQSSCVSNRQPSPHRSSTTSNRSAYCFPVASPPKAHWQPLKSGGGQVKRLRALQSQAEGLETSADLQVFTHWLIESGVEGISGTTQKVEIFQYGEDGRGLRATTVLALPLIPHPRGNQQDTIACRDVRAYDQVLS